jgi:hypothetical protein
MKTAMMAMALAVALSTPASAQSCTSVDGSEYAQSFGFKMASRHKEPCAEARWCDMPWAQSVFGTGNGDGTGGGNGGDGGGNGGCH